MAQAMKIAIIDDEQDMRQSISQWLALSGFDTETFPSAEDALKQLGPDYPGVVVSDIKMPGMNGLQLLARAAELRPRAVRMLITGWTESIPEEAIREVGVDTIIPKPWDDAFLKESLRKAAKQLT